MKIKITNCSDYMYWYRQHIGEIFNVERVSQYVYWCREPNEYRCLNLVLKEDCEIYKEED